MMEIDLRLPSGEHDGDDEESIKLDNLLGSDEKLHGEVGEHLNMLEAGNGVASISLTSDMVEFKGDESLEPLSGMEFSSHGEAYSFYQEYARSVGFNTAIQNSRRSKTTREFIDAKFACSRYGMKREYDKGCNRQRSRQGNSQDPETATGRRPCSKTDCKASMHVKRRSDGKWIIHSFVKEHNHELLPAQAVSEQTMRMYAAMARQFAEYKNVFGLRNDSKSPFDRCRNFAIEAGDAKILLDFLVHLQNENSNFFYAIDVNEDLQLKNLLWVDAKSRHDYVNFSDVVSFDTTYVRNKYKLPLALFVGVNQHYQFILLGCALVSEEGSATYYWLLHTWLKAMGGEAPHVLITDQDPALRSVISEILPDTQHCICLWHVYGKVFENLGQISDGSGSFFGEFEKCVYRSWAEEEFEARWSDLIRRFDLKEYDLIQALYDDRKRWVPAYTKEIFFAGMSTSQRSESVNSHFDKYVHKKTTVQEFIKQYEALLQDSYEEEAKADSDTWNKQPVLKSPSPLEKHVANIYTHAVFKKFQVEVLGAVACHPKREKQDGSIVIFKVQDFDKSQDFTVMWNESKSEVLCLCCLFEYKGLLCRHALIVLQICGNSEVPPQYILRRWTKDAKNRHVTGELYEHGQSRLQRYNELCRRATRLCEEGSLSQESYGIVIQAFDDILGSCISTNNTTKSMVEIGNQASHGLHCMDDENQSRSMTRASKKKNPTKKKKMNSEHDVVAVSMQDGFPQMEKLSSRPVSLDSFYGAEQSVHGMVQLNLMAPTRESYYSGQPIQGLGQLNSIGQGHDGYYASQQSMHGLGQMDFFRNPTAFAYGIRDESSVRSAQLHDESARHG